MINFLNDLKKKINNRNIDNLEKYIEHYKYFENNPSIKKISVIIPNYNYEKFLLQRLKSIVNQTYIPYEIIFLDDNSSDNSVNIAKDFLSSNNIPYKILANNENRGCFKQWSKGIKESSGEIIWIAESDDLCKHNFLQVLIEFFNDLEVSLAYCKSKLIDEDANEIIGYSYDDYLSDLSNNKWLESYTNYAQSEIIEGLGIKNTIPNASSVIFKKSCILSVLKELETYNIAGDWFSYIKIIKDGKIAYSNQPINFHRRHNKSIVSQQERNIEFFRELINVKFEIANNYLISRDIQYKFRIHVENEFYRLIGKNNQVYKTEIFNKLDELDMLIDEKIKKYSFLENVDKKNILFVSPDFEIGGGQVLVVRLANYISNFHNVYLYNARPYLKDNIIINMISKKVINLPSTGNPEQLKSYILDFNIKVINSHVWWADKIVYKAIKKIEDVNWIISMHGCYETLIKHKDCDLEFIYIYEKMFDKANHIIYASDKNKVIFNGDKYDYKISKIYYGYNLQSIDKKDIKILGIKENDFIFGLVSRAMPEKGWEESVLNIIQINEEIKDKSIHLILIGKSEFQKKLKEEYDFDYIHFIDDSIQPSEWIGWVKNFHVGLLPTYFISESLPNTIIEYLAYNIPVISTDIGEIKNMLIDNDVKAGVLVPFKDDKVDINELYLAMKDIYLNKDLYEELKEGTNKLFLQFNIANFMNEYFNKFL